MSSPYLPSPPSDLGTHTCGGYPGTLGHIQDDANTFADWGVDMLKLDGCYASEAEYETGYPNMTAALNSTGRPIVFSCSWPAYVSKVRNVELRLVTSVFFFWNSSSLLPPKYVL